jgi:hypothetical protein
MVGTKSREISGGEREERRWVQGDSTRWEKIAESNVGFFGG